jgi:hypothetical protein
MKRGMGNGTRREYWITKLRYRLNGIYELA